MTEQRVTGCIYHICRNKAHLRTGDVSSAVIVARMGWGWEEREFRGGRVGGSWRNAKEDGGLARPASNQLASLGRVASETAQFLEYVKNRYRSRWVEYIRTFRITAGSGKGTIQHEQAVGALRYVNGVSHQ